MTHKINEQTLRKVAKDACASIRRKQLEEFQQAMTDDRKGYEFQIGGRTFVAAVRRLTPKECDRLQGIPEDYNWDGISESQHYKMDGNGWQVDTIAHCFRYMPKFDRPIRVWSLFDGMSCAHLALDIIGQPIEVYVSSEVDRHAIQAEIQNFPDMVQVGSVTEIDVDNLVERYGVPDLICGGSPCQSFSFSGKMKGMSTAQGEEIYTLDRYMQLKREGFQFEGQSYLFWEYMRILTEVRRHNPDVLFFLENVEMLEKWERCLSHAIGVRGVHINSALVCAQQRRRIYWSNFRVKRIPQKALFDDFDTNDPFAMPLYQTDIPQPEDRGIVIEDIMHKNPVDPRFYMKSEKVGELMRHTDMSRLSDYMLRPQFTEKELSDEISLMHPDWSPDETALAAKLGMADEEKRLKEMIHESNDELFKSYRMFDDEEADQ